MTLSSPGLSCGFHRNTFRNSSEPYRIAELANVILFTGPDAQTSQFNGPSYAALQAYPAILLLFASAVTAASSNDAERWKVFGACCTTNGWPR